MGCLFLCVCLVDLADSAFWTAEAEKGGSHSARHRRVAPSVVGTAVRDDG